MLIVLMSGDDRNFRMQFNSYGKLQPFSLFLQLSIKKIEEQFLQRNQASFLCSNVIYELLVRFCDEEICTLL
jgi:hypothetical protein